MSQGKSKSFKAPFIEKQQIEDAAEEFRTTYWKDQKYPIDIEIIVEIYLGIDIIPVKNLQNNNEIDAFISKDFQSITIDSDIYYLDSSVNRRRFSLAHEVGHIMLHKELYKSVSFDNADEWIDFIESIPEDQYAFIEYHAYEFAGRLLVPRTLLIESIKDAAQIIVKESLFPPLLVLVSVACPKSVFLS